MANKKLYEVPTYVVALLKYLSDELCRIKFNGPDKEFPSPFENTGNHYENKTFKVRAYDWGNDDSDNFVPNFEWGSIKIYWYKYLGRNTEANVEITPPQAVKMFNDCLASIIAENEDDF